MDDKSFSVWPADLARASIVWLLYVGGLLFTYVLTWALSWFGLGLGILTVIFGPFVGAWLACRLLPADRPLVPTLGWGILLGLVFGAFVGVAVVKIAERRHLGGDYDRVLIVSVVGGPLLGALTFSRLKRWSSD